MVVLVGLYVLASVYWTLTDSLSSTVIRKPFHFAISAVFVSGLHYDVDLLEFTSKIVLFILLFIEVSHSLSLYFYQKLCSFQAHQIE